MDADTFVSELSKCAPPLELLTSVGLSTDEAEAFRQRNRASVKSNERAENPIIDLIKRYDVSTIEIGSVRFIREVVKDESWWQIGEAEADPLVINKFTGEVEVRDLADETYTVARCASDAGAFLDALLEAARLLCRAAYDIPLAADQNELCAAARRSAKLAGGAAYAGFFNALVGCDA